jgi:cation:H+ antiporter
MAPWMVFGLSAGVVIVAGARLALDGDAISRRSGLEAGWLGAILVAAATSLPEIATDVSAVRQGQPALAVGDLFGSSMINMLWLALSDLATRRVRLLKEVALSQAIIGTLAIALTAVAAVALVVGDRVAVFGIGWAPLVIVVGYVLGTRLMYQNRGVVAKERGPGRSLRAAVVGFAVSAAVILAAAPFLARSSAALVEQWGVSATFFGAVFLAVATSLPEVAVVVTAIRAGALSLAVGSLLGSNCFNMVILAALDPFAGGAILASGNPEALVGAVFAILITAMTVLDLLNESEHRVWYLEPGPLLVIGTYGAGLYLTWQAGH